MKVYILGAGASKGYNQSKTGISPPLAREFFKVFYELDISNDIDVRIGDILTYIRDTRKIDFTDIVNWNEDIEHFLTEIESKLHILEKEYYDGDQSVEVELISLQKVYDRMIFLFSSVLNEIQNGSTCENLSKLVENSNDGDVFITFNWDTLLDRALLDSQKWYFEDGYGIKFNSVFEDGWRVLDNSKKSSFKLYKLHGSTNWLIPYYSYLFIEKKWGFYNNQAYKMKNPLFLYHYATQKYPTYDDRSRIGYEPFSYFYYPPDIKIQKNVQHNGYYTMSMNMYPDTKNYGTTYGDKMDKTSMPLIIPPVKYKNYDFAGGKLKSLWTKSKIAISKSDEILIIGYSFPETDLKAWELFEKMKLEKKEYKISVVDPFPENIIERIETKYPKLKGSITKYAMTLNEYMKKYV